MPTVTDTHQPFDLVSDFEPTGDQPKAINELVEGLERGDPYQTLLGVTGSGKTYSIANVIEEVNKPTLIMSHNKTLAAQLYGELKQFFPHNAVEYFISYYDYYQPEAYIVPTTTPTSRRTYVDQRPRSTACATRATSRRSSRARDVIIVAERLVHLRPRLAEEYREAARDVRARRGSRGRARDLIRQLVDIQYEPQRRSTSRAEPSASAATPSTSIPAYEETWRVRIEFFGDEVEQI